MTDKLRSSQQKQSLIAFGLTSQEADMYIWLKNKPAQTVVDIARSLSMPRTSVYDAIDKLTKRGLIAKVIVHKSLKIRALPIDILQTVIDKETEKLKNLEQHLVGLKKELLVPRGSDALTEVTYYHGVEGFKQLMWNTLSARDEIIRYPEFGRIEIVGKKFYHSWVEQIIERQIKERAIISPKENTISHFFTNDEYEKRIQYQQTHILPDQALYISGDTAIYNMTFSLCFWKKG